MLIICIVWLWYKGPVCFRKIAIKAHVNPQRRNCTVESPTLLMHFRWKLVWVLSQLKEKHDSCLIEPACKRSKRSAGMKCVCFFIKPINSITQRILITFPPLKNIRSDYHLFEPSFYVRYSLGYGCSLSFHICYHRSHRILDGLLSDLEFV